MESQLNTLIICLQDINEILKRLDPYAWAKMWIREYPPDDGETIDQYHRRHVSDLRTGYLNEYQLRIFTEEVFGSKFKYTRDGHYYIWTYKPYETPPRYVF